MEHVDFANIFVKHVTICIFVLNKGNFIFKILTYFRNVHFCYISRQGATSIANIAAPMKTRNKKGQFKKTPKQTELDVLTDHNYVSGHICQPGGCDACVPGIEKLVNSKKFSTDYWKFGRRVVEWPVFVQRLQQCDYCKCCKIRPKQRTK